MGFFKILRDSAKEQRMYNKLSVNMFDAEELRKICAGKTLGLSISKIEISSRGFGTDESGHSFDNR